MAANKTSKKKSADFNLSSVIRELLKSNRKLSGTEFYELVVKEYPKQKIDRRTFNSTWSRLRNAPKGKKSSVKKTVKRKRPSITRLSHLKPAQGHAKNPSHIPIVLTI